MLKSKTDLSRLGKEDPPKPEGPLKRPIIDSNINPQMKMFGFNKPLVVVEYENHEQGIIQRKDLEMDNVCELKQGFVGLITREIPFDGKG